MVFSKLNESMIIYIYMYACVYVYVYICMYVSAVQTVEAYDKGKKATDFVSCSDNFDP